MEIQLGDQPCKEEGKRCMALMADLLFSETDKI